MARLRANAPGLRPSRVLRVRIVRPPQHDACGPRPVRPGGGLWSCSFQDDFTGTTLDRSKWHVTTHSPVPDPTRACYRDHPQNVAVVDGSLRLTARLMPLQLSCLSGGHLSLYTSGAVSTYGRFSQTYGRFEIRYRNARARAAGLQEAFWLFPDVHNLPPGDTFGRDGHLHEIDIVETFSRYPALAIPFLHYPPTGDSQPRTAYCATTRNEFHTYTLEWTASRIEVFVDGRSCLVNTGRHPAFAKPFIIGVTMALGSGNNAYLPLLGPPLPATMEVDYVRVWR